MVAAYKALTQVRQLEDSLKPSPESSVASSPRPIIATALSEASRAGTGDQEAVGGRADGDGDTGRGSGEGGGRRGDGGTQLGPVAPDAESDGTKMLRLRVRLDRH